VMHPPPTWRHHPQRQRGLTGACALLLNMNNNRENGNTGVHASVQFHSPLAMLYDNHVSTVPSKLADRVNCRKNMVIFLWILALIYSDKTARTTRIHTG